MKCPECGEDYHKNGLSYYHIHDEKDDRCCKVECECTDCKKTLDWNHWHNYQDGDLKCCTMLYECGKKIELRETVENYIVLSPCPSVPQEPACVCKNVALRHDDECEWWVWKEKNRC